MAKTYIIYKDESGLRWRDASINLPGGYLPKSIRTAEEMKKYFGQGEKYHKVDLIFRSPDNKAVKFYEISRSKGRAVVDFEKTLHFSFNQDIADFLSGYVDEEISEKAGKIVDLRERIELLKQNVSPETLHDFDKLVTEKYSDENLKAICEENAKIHFSRDAIVSFID